MGWVAGLWASQRAQAEANGACPGVRSGRGTRGGQRGAGVGVFASGKVPRGQDEGLPETGLADMNPVGVRNVLTGSRAQRRWVSGEPGWVGPGWHRGWGAVSAAWGTGGPACPGPSEDSFPPRRAMKPRGLATRLTLIKGGAWCWRAEWVPEGLRGDRDPPSQPRISVWTAGFPAQPPWGLDCWACPGCSGRLLLLGRCQGLRQRATCALARAREGPLPWKNQSTEGRWRAGGAGAADLPRIPVDAAAPLPPSPFHAWHLHLSPPWLMAPTPSLASPPVPPPFSPRCRGASLYKAQMVPILLELRSPACWPTALLSAWPLALGASATLAFLQGWRAPLPHCERPSPGAPLVLMPGH